MNVWGYTEIFPSPLSGPGLLLFTQRLMYIANCQRIQWSNIMNV